MTRPLLSAEGISVTFRSSGTVVDAVRRASLRVSEGEAIGIVGESGSGKTTLARVLVGLQKATAGRLTLDGRVIFDEGPRARHSRSERWKIQMVFQDPYSSLNPRQRVWQSVAEALHVWQGLKGGAARSAALQLLRDMGISEEQAQHLPKSLSGGQRQRVSVARALAPRPRILIADEPTSAIDQSAQAQLLNLLRRQQEERGLAIVFISHDLGVVRYLTSRVYVMHEGIIVEQGRTQELFDQPKEEYTRTLISSIPGRRDT